MTIDKKPISSVVTPPETFYEDPHKEKAKNVVVIADADTTLVAQNIDKIRLLADNISKIIHNTELFNNRYSKLINEIIYQENTMNAIDVIDSGLDFKKDGSLDKIVDVSSISKEISLISNFTNEITEVSKLKEVIKSLVDIIDDIRMCSSISDQIVMNSALHKEITEVITYHEELIKLDFELDKLLTIYKYLPEILRTSEFVKIYLDIKGELQFTDKEYFETLSKIVNNLDEIYKVANSLDDLNRLLDILDKAPDIVEDVIRKLENASITYNAKLKDLYEELVTKLNTTISKADLSIKEDISKVHQYTLDIKELTLNGKETFIKLDNFMKESKLELRELTNRAELQINDTNTILKNTLKDYEVQYNNLKNEIIILRNEYQSFKDNVDMYVKAQIVDLLKVTLEPIFKENNMTIDGLDKLLVSDLANPNGEYPNGEYK